jgi:hypothetical protein
MILNSDLEALGMDSSQMSAYWQDKTTQEAINKTDAINRQDLKTQYQSAIMALDAIISGAAGNDKTLAVILKRLLLYMKSEIL